MTDPVVAIIAQQALKKEECWINVYRLDTGEIWYGSKYNSKVFAILNMGRLNKKVIYRIHVRLK